MTDMTEMTEMTTKPLRAAATVCLALGLLAADTPRQAPPVRTAHHSFADVEHWAKVWESPERDDWQKPLMVLDVLGVQRGDVVADLGAGTGYFTLRLANAAGLDGRVYAVDIEQAMLDHVAKNKQTQYGRIVPLLAAPDDPRLPAGEIDLVLVVNTWHHIGNRAAYLPRLQAALSPSGRVAVIDFHAGELPVGPAPAEKLSRDQVVAEFEKAGFQLVAESVALPYQYFLTFHPTRPRG